MDPTSNNYELRLLGQAGDDMDANREELFGSSVGPQDGGGVGDGNLPNAAGRAAAAATAEESEPAIDPCPTQSMAGNKRRRKSTSPVWKHFEEIFEMRRGKEVRVDAMCKHCKKL